MNFFKKLLIPLKSPLTQDAQPTPQPIELREPVTTNNSAETEAANQAAR